MLPTNSNLQSNCIQNNLHYWAPLAQSVVALVLWAKGRGFDPHMEQVFIGAVRNKETNKKWRSRVLIPVPRVYSHICLHTLENLTHTRQRSLPPPSFALPHYKWSSHLRATDDQGPCFPTQHWIIHSSDMWISSGKSLIHKKKIKKKSCMLSTRSFFHFF